MNLEGLSYRQMVEGAYKCVAGERVSNGVAEARLARCAECTASSLGIYKLGALLQCGECQCLLGCLGPLGMIQVRGSSDSGTLEERTRAAINPICKVTVKGEKCPRGLW